MQVLETSFLSCIMVAESQQSLPILPARQAMSQYKHVPDLQSDFK